MSGDNEHMPVWEMNDEIVISGIAGRFPESDSIDELRDNLYNHVDMITEDERRWPLGIVIFEYSLFFIVILVL